MVRCTVAVNRSSYPAGAVVITGRDVLRAADNMGVTVGEALHHLHTEDRVTYVEYASREAYLYALKLLKEQIALATRELADNPGDEDAPIGFDHQQLRVAQAVGQAVGASALSLILNRVV